MSLTGLSIATLPLPLIRAARPVRRRLLGAGRVGLEGGIVYAVDLFDASTIDAFAGTFVRVLEG